MGTDYQGRFYPKGPQQASSHGLSHFQEAIQLDGEIFFALLRRASPLAHRHLRRQRIDPVLYMTEWFMCIFARTLPWASVLRVWDMFFCEGTSVAIQAMTGLRFPWWLPEGGLLTEASLEAVLGMEKLRPDLVGSPPAHSLLYLPGT